MKTISKVLLLLNFLFIVLSCDIKNNKTCKDQLSSSIRQINSIHKGFYDNRDSENHLNLLSVRSFYNDYIDRLNNLSNELAKINITKKYQKLSSDLSGLITYEIGYINDRQSISLKMFKMSSLSMNYKRNTKYALEYYIDRNESRYMYKTYIKYKSEQKESIKNFKTEIISLNEYFENYNNNINKIIFKTDSINQLSARFKIDSKVEIKKYITDTTDIISTYPAVIKEAILQLKTVDEIFESNQIDIYRQLK